MTISHLVVLLLPAFSPAAFAADPHHFNDVHQALSAARASPPLEAQAICRDLPSLPAPAEVDLRALYDELSVPKICPKLEPVAKALGQCTDPKFLAWNAPCVVSLASG